MAFSLMTDSIDLKSELLYRALAAPIGIAIATNNAQRARVELCQARKATQDQSLMRLDITLSPEHPDREVWMIKRPEGWNSSKAPKPMTSLNDLGLD